jgi:hypothetical protein
MELRGRLKLWITQVHTVELQPPGNLKPRLRRVPGGWPEAYIWLRGHVICDDSHRTSGMTYNQAV